MACAGACFAFIHRCIGFIWRACCQPNFPTNPGSDACAHSDSISKRNSHFPADSYGYAYHDAHPRWNVNSLVNVYSNPDAESDADQNSYRYPDFNPLPNADTYQNVHRHSYSGAIAHSEPERARHQSRRDAGRPTGNRPVIPYTHTDENVNTRAFAHTITDCHADSLFHPNP